jgi:hypothetical protein
MLGMTNPFPIVTTKDNIMQVVQKLTQANNKQNATAVNC